MVTTPTRAKKTKPMKSGLFLIATLALLALESCGPSAEQKATIEKAKMDSLLTVTKKATEDSISISSGMTFLLNRKTLTAKAIPFIQSEIEMAKTSKTKAMTDMENIKSFQLGRTQSEKQSQIANQVNVQEQVEEHLSSLEAVLKVFKHALTEMDGIEKKQFASLTEFESFKNDLSGRIQKMEKEIIDDSGLENLGEQFSFEKTITDETFIKKVMDYNKADSIATTLINSINEANK